jgi:hypothetical protein
VRPLRRSVPLLSLIGVPALRSSVPLPPLAVVRPLLAAPSVLAQSFAGLFQRLSEWRPLLPGMRCRYR